MFVRHMTGPQNCSGSVLCPAPHSCSLLSSLSQHASLPCLLRSQGTYSVPLLCWRVQSQGNWKDLGCQEVDDLPDTKLPQRLQCHIQSHGFLQLLSWTALCSDQYWSWLDQIFTQRRANNVSWWAAGWTSHTSQNWCLHTDSSLFASPSTFLTESHLYPCAGTQWPGVLYLYESICWFGFGSSHVHVYRWSCKEQEESFS